jgi:hypothetical protein
VRRWGSGQGAPRRGLETDLGVGVVRISPESSRRWRQRLEEGGHRWGPGQEVTIFVGGVGETRGDNVKIVVAAAGPVRGRSGPTMVRCSRGGHR